VFGLSLFSENMSANEIDVKSERDQVKRKNVGRPRAFPRRANCILWFDRSSNIVCFRENMAHKCSLDFSDHQMPYKKNRVSPASISDFLFRSRRMDNRGEDYYSRARFHLDPNIYVEDSCFGIIPPIPDCLIASKEYVLKNWINESSKYFKVSAVSCYPSWEDSTFRQCRWKIKCQVGNNIYAMVGYGSIRVLFFMFRRIDGYVLRKLPSELSVECGGAMCVNCQKGVVREEVLLMAALFVLRSVRGELNPFPLPRVHSKLLDFNRMSAMAMRSDRIYYIPCVHCLISLQLRPIIRVLLQLLFVWSLMILLFYRCDTTVNVLLLSLFLITPRVLFVLLRTSSRFLKLRIMLVQLQYFLLTWFILYFYLNDLLHVCRFMRSNLSLIGLCSDTYFCFIYKI